MNFMFKLERRIYGMNIGMIWFAPGLEDRKNLSKLTYVLPESDANRDGFRLEAGGMMNVIDLGQNEESIFSQFHRDTRRRIKSAKEEPIAVEYNKSYGESVELMNDFFARKRLRFPGRISEQELRQSAHLLVEGRFKGRLVYVSYMALHKDFASQLFTCTRDLGEEQGVTGTIAKLAHFEAMKRLKGEGLKRYSFGSVDKVDDSEGRSAFKLSFGGQVVQSPSYTKIYNPLLKLVKGVGLK